MTDTIDLNQKREAKAEAKAKAEAGAAVKRELGDVLSALGDAMSVMQDGPFIEFVQFAASHLPAHSVIKAHWFQSALSSLVGVFTTQMTPEDTKRYFTLMIDFLHQAYVEQNGSPPEYPPVLCSDCEEHPPGVDPAS